MNEYIVSSLSTLKRSFTYSVGRTSINISSVFYVVVVGVSSRGGGEGGCSKPFLFFSSVCPIEQHKH